MIANAFRITSLFLAGAVLWGCDTSYQYAQPANLTLQSAATITGSKIETPGLSGDVRVYLLSIDGKLTMDGPNGWDDRVLATPGPHLIRFGITQGSAFTLVGGNYIGMGGQAQVSLDPGKLYTLRSSVPAVASGGMCALGWIADDGGRLVADKVSIKMVQRGGEFAAPISGGGAVPIRVPGGDINAVSCSG